MRLTSYDGRFRENSNYKTDQHYSFQHDWLMMSLLAARLLGVNVNRLLDLRIAPFEIAEYLSATEAKLLRAMAHGEPEGRLNGELVLYAEESVGIELSNTVYALDSTTIDLCLSLFPWAHFRSTKAAVKMHTLLDLRGNIPSFIHISDGKLRNPTQGGQDSDGRRTAIR